MKYIDADRLRVEIDRQKIGYNIDGKHAAEYDTCVKILRIIDSLQQEKPDCHTVEEWMQHIKNSDQLTKDIFSKGPYDVLYDALNHPYQNCYDAIKEFGELCFKTGVNSVKQEQPEADLEKFTEKIKTFQGRYKHPEIVSIKGAMSFMARMFYQYPNVARRWYEQLPKVTMD